MIAAETMERFQTLFLGKRASFLVQALCFLILAYAVYAIVMDWLQGAQKIPDPVINVPHSTVTIASLPQEHLFGDANTGNLEKTNLQLTLEGVLTANDSVQSSAIIASSGQPGKVYRPGDEILPGATLFQVLAQSVIIKNRGRLEELPLVRSQLVFAPQAPSLFDGQ